MPLKTVALIAAVSVTIGWLLAAMLTPPVARLQSLPERQVRPAVAAESAPFTELLNLRLREAPLPPASRRNPFTFGARERTALPPRITTEPELPPAVHGPQPVPIGPVYALSGIGITGDVRTAVLTDGENVRVVKVEDVIDRFTVVEISDSSVTLASGTETYTLRLPQ